MSMNINPNKRFTSGYDEYVVKQGDSLYQIAKLFHTTVADISDANMLTSSTIYPGQVLMIPKAGLQQFTVFEDYRTVEGDTMAESPKRPARLWHCSEPITISGR